MRILTSQTSMLLPDKCSTWNDCEIMKLVFDFLKKLSKNNTREWMADNKSEYNEAKKEFEEFVVQLIGGISKFDEGISGLKPKECIFRVDCIRSTERCPN